MRVFIDTKLLAYRLDQREPAPPDGPAQRHLNRIVSKIRWGFDNVVAVF